MCGMALISGDPQRHLQKLAALVTQRRVALGYGSKEAAAAACGISHMTYRKIEGTKGTPPQRAEDATYAKVDVGFGFRPGSCRAVADGAVDSITLEDGTELIEGGAIRDFVNLEDEMDRAFDKSAQLTAPHLTLSEARAMKEEMFRQLRDRGALPR
jgi:hypothetical protein